MNSHISNNCLFCRITSGESKSWTVFEDGSVKAFLNIYPLTRGHTLIVPKKHYEGVSEIPDQTLRHMISIAKKLTRNYERNLNAQGVCLHSQDHKYKTIKFRHYHLHVIPRYNQNDRYDFSRIWPKNVPKAKSADLNGVLSQLPDATRKIITSKKYSSTIDLS